MGVTLFCFGNNTSKLANGLFGFKKVQQTFEEFGDVRTVQFSEWWDERGIDLFAVDHVRPRVRQVAQLDKNQGSDPDVVKLIRQYFKKPRVREGLPPALLLSVPLGVNKKALLSQISKLIDQADVPVTPKSHRAKKPLAAKRLRPKPLFRTLKTIAYKAAFPNETLWQIGVSVGVSPTNATGLDVTGKKLTKNTADQRIHMSILTSRMLLKAKLIAENAARGEFPSSKKIPLPYFDYNVIQKRFVGSLRAQDKATRLRQPSATEPVTSEPSNGVSNDP